MKKKNKPGVDKITGPGLLDGEFTLVYEDIEGDRMLVGDVPWKYAIPPKSKQIKTNFFD